MTDNEIIKALECCRNNGTSNTYCEECAYSVYEECGAMQAKDALDLINRQKAEIEKLKPFEKKVLEPVIKEFQRRDCPFSPFDEYCTGHCVNCENRLECVDCSKRLKSEAYKKFWDRLKKEADFISGGDYGFSFEIREDVAEEIIKELTEENK